MKVKRMGITEILKRIWLFFANEIKSSESFSKQPIQLIIELNSSLGHIIVKSILFLVEAENFLLEEKQNNDKGFFSKIVDTSRTINSNSERWSE